MASDRSKRLQQNGAKARRAAAIRKVCSNLSKGCARTEGSCGHMAQSLIRPLLSLPLCSVETLKAQSGVALFNTTHVLERCQSSRSPPSSRHTLPSGMSLLAPGPTSTRTQPGQAAATRATVRLPDVRSTATCQKVEGSAGSNIGKRKIHENEGGRMLGRPARRRGSRHEKGQLVQADLPRLAPAPQFARSP
jgi:hypothetical protein